MMSNGGQKRTRSERVAAVELPPSQLTQVWIGLRTRETVARIGLTLLAAVVLCVVMSGWDPPFVYRTGFVPTEDIVATVPFSKPDQVATDNGVLVIHPIHHATFVMQWNGKTVYVDPVGGAKPFAKMPKPLMLLAIVMLYPWVSIVPVTPLLMLIVRLELSAMPAAAEGQ